jgi:hypothetical protein
MGTLDDRFRIGQGGAYEFDKDTNISIDQSLRAAVRFRPIDVTLATTNTVEDAINLESLPVYTVNTVKNPSFEHATPATGWTADASTLATGSNQRTGTNSLSITGDNGAVGEGAYYVLDNDVGSTGNKPTIVIASFYAKRASSSGDTIRVEITDSAGTSLANGNTLTLTTSYQRTVAFYVIPLGTTFDDGRIYARTTTQHGTAVEIDDVQVEYRVGRSSATPFAWGDGGVDCHWVDPANPTTTESYRETPLQIIRGFSLEVTGGDLLIALDNEAKASFTVVETGATSTSVLIKSGSTWSTDQPINLTRNISIVNRVSGETPRIQGWVWGLV